jgi:Na+:H+ antiporter, NhaA family
MYRVSPFVRHFARALIAGIALATAWVNLSPDSYYDAIEYRIADLPFPAGLTALPDSVTPLSLISGGLMALVMAFLVKEFWEAVALERGALRRQGAAGRPALLPLAAVLGGTLGAVGIWLVLSQTLPQPLESWPGAGWPVPIGADVVLAYAAGRLGFGEGHPALHLLLMITIAFDVLGLILTGLAFPSEGLKPDWLLLSAGSILLVWALAARHARADAPERLKRRAAHLWPYALAGLGSWLGVAFSGLPGALGLIPLVPLIPHAERTFGLFAEAEAHLHDPLNRLAQALVWPVTTTLFLFGLTRGGIDFGAFAPTTLTTLGALLIGKPLGLIAGIFLVLATGQASLPPRMSRGDIFRIAALASIGFTIPALSIDASLPGGEMAEAARMGLAISLVPAGFSAALSAGLGRLWRRGR